MFLEFCRLNNCYNLRRRCCMMLKNQDTRIRKNYYWDKLDSY